MLRLRHETPPGHGLGAAVRFGACEEAARSAALGLTPDERAASMGVSARLFAWQVPQIWHMCMGVDAALAQAQDAAWPLARQGRFLALHGSLYREFCGVLRGCAQWLQHQLASPVALKLLHRCSHGFGQGKAFGLDRRCVKAPRLLAGTSPRACAACRAPRARPHAG